MTIRIQELAACLCGVEGLRRLGQALWMLIERPVDKAGLVWARGLLGERGDQVLWSALLEEGVVAEPEHRIDAGRLTGFLSKLVGGTCPHADPPRLVWTLPIQLQQRELEDTYSLAALDLIDAARDRLLIVSPFLEARGVGKLLEALLRAMKRGVNLTIVTHTAQRLSSFSSAALEDLRKGAANLPGGLAVYAAREDLPTLLHSKLMVADDERVIVGSANVTAGGLEDNLESGVVLGHDHAIEVKRIVDVLLKSSLVTSAYSTFPRN